MFVRRNSNMPHRCPICHSVRSWDYGNQGKRFKLTLTCDGIARTPSHDPVRWLYGRST